MGRAPTVAIRLMQRTDKSQYFEICVSSDRTFKNAYNRPQLRSIVERDFNSEVKLEAVAGALAEELCERFGATLDPGEVARAARSLYLDFNRTNPRPVLGDEAPI